MEKKKVYKHEVVEEKWYQRDWLKILGSILIFFIVFTLLIYFVTPLIITSCAAKDLGKKVEAVEANQGQNKETVETTVSETKEVADTSTETTNTTKTNETPLIEPGFKPDPGLIDITKEANLPKIPKDSVIFKEYRIFPDVKGIWGKPRAGYNDGFNDEFSSSDRLRNVQIPTWKWLAFTGEEGSWPGVGSLKDPDGGAILLVVINVWEVPGEFTLAYLLHGFWAFGEVWDMSDMLDNGDNTAPKYGQYTLETMATIRNHYINQLGSTEPNPEFRGQTGKATQAETITWACVLRWYDGSFRLVDSGQWVRGQ